MDDVYLLNNPFTFQAMEKHSAYCAMMRLGMRVPDDVADPAQGAAATTRASSRPPSATTRRSTSRRSASTSSYPLFMKPFDGGQWVGVSRVGSPEELRARYDESGERMMHLQTALEDFDVFVRSLSIGAETMAMWFDPTQADARPLPGDATTSCTPELGDEIIDDLAARQRVLPLGVQLVRDDREGRRSRTRSTTRTRRPTSRSRRCTTTSRGRSRRSSAGARSARSTRREMRINQNSRDYFDWGDRDDLDLRGEARRRTGELADDYFQVDAYKEFCATPPRAPRRDRARVVHVGRSSTTLLVAHRALARSRRTSTSTSSRTTAACSQPGRATTQRCRIRPVAAAPIPRGGPQWQPSRSRRSSSASSRPRRRAHARASRVHRSGQAARRRPRRST